MTTTVQVSNWTKDLLDAFKEAEEHTSLDSVIRSLIMHAVVGKSMMATEFKEHPTHLDAKSRYLGLTKTPFEIKRTDEEQMLKNHLIPLIKGWEEFNKKKGDSSNKER